MGRCELASVWQFRVQKTHTDKRLYHILSMNLFSNQVFGFAVVLLQTWRSCSILGFRRFIASERIYLWFRNRSYFSPGNCTVTQCGQYVLFKGLTPSYDISRSFPPRFSPRFVFGGHDLETCRDQPRFAAEGERWVPEICVLQGGLEEGKKVRRYMFFL